jgi:hypothetical protein
MVEGLVLKRSLPQTMIDEKAFQSLENNSQYFIKLLGEPRKEKNGFTFPIRDLPFAGFHIRYEVEKKFLGRIYVMVLEGTFSQGEMSPPSERMELRYSGFIRKGKPFFISLPSKKVQNKGNRALNLLSEDPPLLAGCWKLDLEFLKVFFDFGEGAWRVQVRPYGGSFIKVLLPPLQYNVPLSGEQAELILSVMKRIAELIARRPQ